ncbi:hypothetical protein HDU99_007900 [Rhizoclosmatium hyalinum]|nr:hypothetical protein HDU99_007900 [Rhizoclosmatium hyalinum]
MSFQQYAAYTWDTCPTGSAVYGVTTSIAAILGTQISCASEINHLTCAHAGSFYESDICSNGAKDLVNQMTGPVVTFTLYSDAVCGSPVQTVAAVVDRCISLVETVFLKVTFNAKFTISSTGNVGVTLYDDGECKVPSKKQTPTFPMALPGCGEQESSIIGQCGKVSAKCVQSGSIWFNHGSLGSFKYQQPVTQVAKNSALSVGISLFTFVAALLVF